jgi:cobalt ECF transporter T component CbiQ
MRIDEMAYASQYSRHPPLGKLALCLALLFASLLAPSPAVPVAVFIISIALLYSSTRFRFHKILLAAFANTLILVVVGALVIAAVTPGDLLFSATAANFSVSFSRQGANLALLVLSRSLAGFAVLLFFASSTPIPHLFLALRQLRFPQHIAELTILVYRYSFLLLEQMGQMWVAADCRLGFSSTARTLRTSGMLISGLFGRSMDTAERAQQALYCRNFTGNFPSYREPAKINLAWAFFPLAVFAVLFMLSTQTKGWLSL